MDVLRIEGSNKSIDLYSWLTPKAQGHEALAGILGFGLPGQENHWFQGSASGSSWRGARTPNRLIKIPLRVYADDRLQLNDMLSDLAVALDPYTGDRYENGPARLLFGMPDEYEWYADVTRTAGGDWARKVDSDDRTFFKTTLELEAGDPFWTRNEPETFEIRQTTSGGATLLPRFARLRLGSAATFGETPVENIGDTYAWSSFTATGPMTGLQMIGPKGEIVDWEGTLLAGEQLFVDMRNGIIEDNLGANRYGGLAPAPQFWSIAPGLSKIGILADGIDANSLVQAQYWPRRWAVV